MDGAHHADFAIRASIPSGLEFPIRDTIALRRAIDESMPQLPLMVTKDGFLAAASDFVEPVGPSFWERG